MENFKIAHKNMEHIIVVFFLLFSKHIIPTAPKRVEYFLQNPLVRTCLLTLLFKYFCKVELIYSILISICIIFILRKTSEVEVIEKFNNIAVK